VPPRQPDAAAYVRSLDDVRDLPTDTAAVRAALLDDRTLAALTRLNVLRVLLSDRAAVTDIGLTSAAALPVLERLSLAGDAALTDAGLAQLYPLGTLRWLDLRGCPRLTRLGITRLSHALPHCEILA
jgi:hypothetical protein